MNITTLRKLRLQFYHNLFSPLRYITNSGSLICVYVSQARSALEYAGGPEQVAARPTSIEMMQAKSPGLARLEAISLAFSPVLQ